MKLHPVAELFPRMPEDEYQALVRDVRENGVLVPVIVDSDGRVVDGRHRTLAAAEAGVPCPTVTWDGTDAWLAAQSANLSRRHLTKEQVVAIRLLAAEKHPDIAAPIKQARESSRERQGERTDLQPSGNAAGKSRGLEASDRIGAQVGASGRTVRNVERAGRVDPEGLRRIAEGQASAQEIVREHRTAEKRERTAQLAAVKAPPVLDAYPVLCADPPWRYDANSTPETRAIENHYPTMTLADIKTLPVPAADDAVLFLWATSPKLAESLEVMEAWGFAYRTCMVWVKDRIGMGYYARQQHELLLIGRRGNLAVPDPEDRPSSVLTAPRGEHSAKPVEAYEAIERMYPDVPRVELFARGPRPRWAVWGNQAQEAA